MTSFLSKHYYIAVHVFTSQVLYMRLNDVFKPCSYENVHLTHGITCVCQVSIHLLAQSCAPAIYLTVDATFTRVYSLTERTHPWQGHLSC